MQQKNGKKLYILCGLSNETGDDVKNALIEAAKHYGYDAVCVSRYRKEGIRQFIDEHSEFRLVVLQESMQSNYPYMAEELSELMDEYHLNIVISLKHSHRGTNYMKILYTAGILNAVYEEDATVDTIIRLLLHPRTRKESREYYQISNTEDAMEALSVVNEERMERYISYIEESWEEKEILGKYRYIAESINMMELMYLIQNLSDHIKEVVEKEESYRKASGLLRKQKKFNLQKKDHRTGEVKVSAVPYAEKMETDKRETQHERKRVHHSRTELDYLLDQDISELIGKDEMSETCLESAPYRLPASQKRVPSADDEQSRRYKADAMQYDIERKTYDSSAPKKTIGIRKVFMMIVIFALLAVIIYLGALLFMKEHQTETIYPIVNKEARYNACTVVAVNDNIKLRYQESVIEVGL